MDGKYDKKKESIDDILSDLNGLLNKMPSILDGIKMPEMQPEVYSKPAPVPEPAPAPEPQTPKSAAGDNFSAIPDDADKTIVLQSFAGLPEGSEVPAEIPAEAAPLELSPREPDAIPAGPDDADKTVVLESLAGLSEGSLVPSELSSFRKPEPVFPAEEEKPVVLESFSGQQGWSGEVQPDEQPAAAAQAAPEQEKLVPQSLGDFMFGEGAQQEAQPGPEKPEAAAPAVLSGTPLEPPLETPVQAAENVPPLLVSEFTPPAPAEELPVAEPQAAQEISPAAVPEAALPVIPEPAPDQMVFTPEASASSGPGEAAPEEPAEVLKYGNTNDFGIPDIDVLMQMSDGEKPAAEQPAAALPEAGLIPESVQAAEKKKEEPALQELPAGLPGDVNPAPGQVLPEELQIQAAVPEEDTMEANEPKEEKTEIPQPEAASPAMAPGDFIIEPEAKAETPFDSFTIEPSSSEPAPAQEGGEVSPAPVLETQPLQDGGETLRLEPAVELVSEAAPEPNPAEPEEIQFGAFTLPEPESKPEAAPEAGSAAPAEIAAEPQLTVGKPMQFDSGAGPEVGGIELSPAIDFGAGSPAKTDGADETLPGGPGLELGSPASHSPSGDETLVVAPPSGDEDKTVIFQAGPATTSRAQAADLSSLSVRPVPEGVPAERVRTLAFLYSPGDEALCATVLAELDAICLKSATKPMFVKRAYVKSCDADSNANFIHQSVADSGAGGLVCLGTVPQEKVYEIENAFASSGGFFRYFDSSSFTHSTALDLVSDLIIR